MALVPPAAPPVSVARHARFAAHRARSVVWRDVLPPELCAAVTACAADASLLEEQENVLESTFQRTRWLPVEQLSHPQTAIEVTIAHLQREVLRLTQADELVGCEWWVQRVRPDAGLAFHFDKDECAAADDRGSELVHPSLSSVLYLSRTGGATVVLPQRVVPDDEAPRGVIMVTDAPGEVDVVVPSPNTFLAFQGDLLHGVLPVGWSPRGDADEDEWRLTLLVNWWSVVPKPPCCSPLPDDMSQALQETHNFVHEPKLEAHDTSSIATQVDLVEIDCSDRNVDCKEIDILAPPHLGLGSSALQTVRVPIDIGPGAYTAQNCDT
jgi:hypothetical protein